MGELIKPADKDSKVMLDLISEEKALNDCESFLERLFEKGQNLEDKDKSLDLNSFLREVK